MTFMQNPQLIQETLSKLRDIHLPEQVNAWPPAIGWWWMLAGILLLVLIIIALLYRRKQTRLRRQALRQLNALRHSYQKTSHAQHHLRQIGLLLRRVALSRHEYSAIASLTGSDWLTFLDKQLDAKGRQNPFREGIGKVIETERFKPDSTWQPDDHFYRLIKRWIHKTC